MKSKILITGAAGFIGFHLAMRLNRDGKNILGYDNFNQYYTPVLKRARAEELKRLGVEVIEGDICQKEHLQCAFDGCTHIVHLAAQAGVRYSLENPKAYLESNIDGFLNILELCRHQPTTKLVYASSSSVYGKNIKFPFAVQDATDSPTSLYGATKKSNELMSHAYHHLFGFEAIGLRFFTVYGPWGRPDMAYYSFAKAIVEGRPIDIYNFGKMRRDFTYIDDIVDGICASLEYNGKCEIFNLGNSSDEELMSLVNSLEKHLDKKAQLNLLPMQAGDVVATYADITESNSKLGYAPKTSLDEGLKCFVEWFKSYEGVYTKTH